MSKKGKASIAILVLILVGMYFTKPSESDFANYMSSFTVLESPNANNTNSYFDNYRMEKDYYLFSVFTYDLFHNGKQIDSELNNFQYLGVFGCFYSL